MRVLKLVILVALHVQAVKRRSCLHSSRPHSIFLKVNAGNFSVLNLYPLKAEYVLAFVQSLLRRGHIQTLDILLESTFAVVVQLVAFQVQAVQIRRECILQGFRGSLHFLVHLSRRPHVIGVHAVEDPFIGHISVFEVSDRAVHRRRKNVVSLISSTNLLKVGQVLFSVACCSQK